MKLEYVDDPALLTRIKRSYAHVWKRMRTEKEGSTRLFRFEYLDCGEIELKYKSLWNFCRRVIVIATGKMFVITQRMVFREDSWSLYRVKEDK